MREKDILLERGAYWVADDKIAYSVVRNTDTHGVTDSSYAHTIDGLSIALARCEYLAKRDALRNQTKGE